MRRGSRAPSMMFQIEAAAAIIAEAEAAMLHHETSSALSNERCDVNSINNRTGDIIEPTAANNATNRSSLRSVPCSTTLLGLQLQQSVHIP